MIRISTIFIAICMVLIAASLGMVVYSVAGFNAAQAAMISLTVLTFFVLYNAISMRLKDRSESGSQIVDLSRGTADLARQIGEFGRRLAAVEAKVVSANSANQDRVQAVSNEIGELGLLVKQLAASVASHDEMLTAAARGALQHEQSVAELPPPLTTTPVDPAMLAPVVAEPIAPAVLPAAAVPERDPAHLIAVVKSAVEAGRIDIYLQPIVTLPQRKVRFYEVVTRLRDDSDQVITATEFLAAAESAGLMGQIDHAVLLRAVQVLRRLLVRNKEVGLFVNLGAGTLSDTAAFSQCLDFLEANRALAPSLVLEFKQSALRDLGLVEAEHLAALAQRGYRFSIDNVADLRFEPRELADRGVRFIKVPAALLLDPREHPAADIHPADLSDLLGRFGIDLIAERIEGERAVVDLLDYDVRFGQGFLFAAPRPLRTDTATAATPASPATAQQDIPSPNEPAPLSQVAAPARIDPPRVTGNAALVRRAAGLL